MSFSNSSLFDPAVFAVVRHDKFLPSYYVSSPTKDGARVNFSALCEALVYLCNPSAFLAAISDDDSPYHSMLWRTPALLFSPGCRISGPVTPGVLAGLPSARLSPPAFGMPQRRAFSRLAIELRYPASLLLVHRAHAVSFFLAQHPSCGTQEERKGVETKLLAILALGGWFASTVPAFIEELCAVWPR